MADAHVVAIAAEAVSAETFPCRERERVTGPTHSDRCSPVRCSSDRLWCYVDAPASA